MGILTITKCDPGQCGQPDCPLYGIDRGKQLPLTSQRGEGIACTPENRAEVKALLQGFAERWKKRTPASGCAIPPRSRPLKPPTKKWLYKRGHKLRKRGRK